MDRAGLRRRRPLYGYIVTASPSGPACSSTGTSCVVTGLVNGVSYTFNVTADNSFGATSSAPSNAVRPVAVDRTAPTVRTAALPIASMTPRVTFRFAGPTRAAWQAMTSGTAVPPGTAALALSPTRRAWQKQTAGSVSFNAAAGQTYCLSVRGRDRAGNVSAFSPERCTTTPLDDRSLAASAGWARQTNAAWFAGTATATTRTGATLTRTAVQTRRIYLLASSCRGCSTVGVYWNGKLLRQVNLNAATTTHRRVLAIADLGTPGAGTLAIRALNSGRSYIDGVVLGRV